MGLSRWFMRRLSLLLITVPALVAQAPGAATESEVRKVVEAYHQAFEQRDLEGLRRLLVPELLVFEGGGVDRGRDTYLGHHLGPELKEMSGWTTSGMNMTFRVEGTLAYATCAFTYEASFKSGKTSKGKATETLVLVNEKDQWLIRHIHWSSRAIKPVKP